MNNNIFRQKNIDRVSSPEKLNDYITVISPPVWFVLSGVIIIIAGALIWGIFGSLNTRVKGAIKASDNTCTLYVKVSDVDKFHEGMEIKTDFNICSVDNVAHHPVKADELDEYILFSGDFYGEKWLYPIEIRGDMPEGTYSLGVIVDNRPPISLIFN